MKKISFSPGKNIVQTEQELESFLKNLEDYKKKLNPEEAKPVEKAIQKIKEQLDEEA